MNNEQNGTREFSDTVARNGEPGKIHAAMAAAMGEIQHVAKTKRNTSQGYQFRGFDDVYLACRGVLSRHGIHVTHSLLSHEWLEKATSKGGAMNVIRAVFRVRFTAVDGSHVETDVFGEAMDSGDKAANKAMSMAMKYALVDTFLIPTDEPRDTESEEMPMIKKQRDQINGFAKQMGLDADAVKAGIKDVTGHETGSHGLSFANADKYLKVLEVQAMKNGTGKGAANGANREAAQ